MDISFIHLRKSHKPLQVAELTMVSLEVSGILIKSRDVENSLTGRWERIRTHFFDSEIMNWTG